MGRPFRGLCLCAPKFRFPDTETALGRDRFDICELLRGETEHLALAGPFGWEIAKAGDAHSMRQPAFNGRFDKVWCQEGK